MFNLRWKGCSKDLWILGGQLRPWENWSHLLSFLLVPGWQILFRKSLCHGVWRGSLSLKKTQVPTVVSRLGKWNSRHKAFGIYTGSTTIWYIISNSILHCVTNTCSYLIKLWLLTGLVQVECWNIKEESALSCLSYSTFLAPCILCLTVTHYGLCLYIFASSSFR